MKLAKKNQHFDFPNNMHWQPLHTPLIYKNTTMYIVVWCAFQYILYTILAPLFLHPEDRTKKSLNEVLIIIVILLVGMIIHEFVHILFIPGSDLTGMGNHPSQVYFLLMFLSFFILIIFIGILSSYLCNK